MYARTFFNLEEEVAYFYDDVNIEINEVTTQ